MTSIRTIAVGFDGSTDAEQAMRWALDLAAQVHADVIVVHAVGLLEHSVRRVSVAGLEGRVRMLTAEAGLDAARVRWSVIDGDPCSVLLRATSPPNAVELLVVGSRGEGARAGLLLGSTGHELAEHTEVPLVIVPAIRPDVRPAMPDAHQPSLRRGDRPPHDTCRPGT